MTEIWSSLYPEEPYELAFYITFSEGGAEKSSEFVENIKYDLVLAVRRQSIFFYQVSRPSMHDDLFLEGAAARNKGLKFISGLPVYFIEPHHPAKFFWRGQFYGENDDFKHFSFFSRATLQLLLRAGKKPDIIHCHDWQTVFVVNLASQAPLYWDLYAPRDLNTARICFTCYNFEYQGTAPASELASCGVDVHQLSRHDRMQDNAS